MERKNEELTEKSVRMYSSFVESFVSDSTTLNLYEKEHSYHRQEIIQLDRRQNMRRGNIN